MESTIKLSLSKEQETEIQQIVVEQIKLILPTLIENIVPFIVDKTKELTKDYLSNLTNRSTPDSFNENEKLQIINENRKCWNKMLDDRENLFYKLQRTTKILDLYSECLEQDEPHVPREFRQNKRHVKNTEESRIIRNLELQRFQAECEILHIRKNNYETDLKRLDKSMLENIKNTTSNLTLQLHLQNKYESFCKIDADRITKQRNKKIASLKKAFEEDRNKSRREILSKKQSNQQPNSNSETSDVFVAETQNITEQDIDTSANTNIFESIPETQEITNTNQEDHPSISKNEESSHQTGKRRRVTRK